MAGLDLASRMVIEAWTGPIAAVDVPEIEERLTALGSPYGVALQMLLTKRSQFTTTAASRSAGDDRHDHTANLKALNQQIQDLVTSIGQLTTYTPTQVVLDMMALAVRPFTASGTIDLVSYAPRRG